MLDDNSTAMPQQPVMPQPKRIKSGHHTHSLKLQKRPDSITDIIILQVFPDGSESLNETNPQKNAELLTSYLLEAIDRQTVIALRDELIQQLNLAYI